MGESIQARLTAGNILIADGSTGVSLMVAGLPSGTPPELWNVENPQAIITLHQDYVDAGAEIILTNTFGGSRIKLEKAGLGDRYRELNGAAVDLAKKAAGDSALVAGDIGPTGELMEPLGTLSFDNAVKSYMEQSRVLAARGVDLFWIETMSDLDEARAAVVGIKQTSELPVFCSLSFGKKGRTMMGISATEAAKVLWPLGLTAIGANCGEGFPPVIEALKQMREELPDAPLIAKPNAGLPRLVGEKTIYEMTPEEFGLNIPPLVELGARIVGGCCGTTASYIAAVANIIHS